MTTPTQLAQLIERFRDNLPDYKQGKYNETQVRREFIDPLFKLLGWDIDNDKGYAEAYKEATKACPKLAPCSSAKSRLWIGRLTGWFMSCIG